MIRGLLNECYVTISLDLDSMSQLQEALAQLITENLEVTRWLLKLDDEFAGQGIAYIDMEHLSCYQWALREAAR